MIDVTVLENFSGARAGTPARATVCAGGVDTEYVRAGRGDAVLLLAGDVDTLEMQQRIDVLARHFLVIAASPPVNAEFNSWLGGFLDGLGLMRASVLVDASLTHLLMTGDSNDV